MPRARSDRANGEFLERRPFGESELEPGPLKLGLRVAGKRHARLPQLAQPLRAEQAQVNEPGEREQRLVRRDVRGRLLPADVLLARLQRQDVAALTRDVDSLTDDPARQSADVVGAGGEKAVVRPAVAHRVPRRLAFADRHRTAVGAGRLEHPERDQVDVRDRHRAALVRDGGELGRSLETTEEVRLLEDHRCGVLSRLADTLGVGRTALVRYLDDLEPEAGRVGLHDLADLRIGRLGHDDLRSPGCMLRDEERVGGDRRPVVARRVRDVHAGELADRGLVLEDRLQHALAHLGLVRRVRGQQLTALQHGVDDRRHVVVVDARTEEADLVDDILRRELLQVPLELGLGERRRNLELARESHCRRNIAEELFDRGDADRREHLLAIGRSEREVAHCVSSTFL